MNETLVGNIVIVAKNLNPSIFTQIWLAKIGVFEEDEFEKESFFSPTAVNIQTPNVDLLIVPDRLQLKFKTDEKQEEIITKTIGNIVKALPHTPYTAIGLNFDLILEPFDQSQYPKAIRELFLSDNNPIGGIFNTDDSRFGTYMSREVFEMRLKLNILPTKIVSGDEKVEKEVLNFRFNFHKAIDNLEKAVDIVIETANKWSQAKKMSEDIVMEISGKWKR